MLPFPRWFRKHYFLPSEHGAWIWWIGPYLIGLAAGGAPSGASLLVFIAALAAYLTRHPTTLAVKALSGRRASRDLAPAIFWAVLYFLIAGAAVWGLIRSGYARLLVLTIPGVPVFLWHLWLVSRRSERGQPGVEVVAAGVLALTAPAAYWTASGSSDRTAWTLWGITWLQSAASIVLVHLRLAQRNLTRVPHTRTRWRMGSRALAYHLFNVILGTVLTILQWVPLTVPIAYGIMFLDALEGTARPAVGARPTSIGLRQLFSSSLFVILVAAGYLLQP